MFNIVYIVDSVVHNYVQFIAPTARYISRMDIPYVRGQVAKQAHVGLPQGTVEEEYGRNGFFGRYAHLYRQHAPVGWSRIEGPLRPRAYDLRRWTPPEGGLVRRDLLTNEDVRIGIAQLAEPSTGFFRNADADELWFVHDGSGRLESDFGPLAYEPGDYLVIPRGITYRWAPSRASRLIYVESAAEWEVPSRGLLGHHALFDPATLRVPTPGETSSAQPDANGEYYIDVKRLGELTRVYYPFCPLDTVGWKGTCAVTQLNVRDIRPILSDRYHVPPTAHATWSTHNAVVCTFLPRPLENGDPTALKVPYYHSNVDYDEVLFYHAGDFFSRQGISAGMLTFHPQGIHHGPQPGAAERARQNVRTEEVAVMIDTRRPLRPTSEAERCEWAEYWQSWRRP
jgi:homogentisate 1,2-dioxygenase